MTKPGEELQKEIQTILAKQRELREVMDGLTQQVRELQNKADSLSHQSSLAEAIPPKEAPVVPLEPAKDFVSAAEGLKRAKAADASEIFDEFDSVFPPHIPEAKPVLAGDQVSLKSGPVIPPIPIPVPTGNPAPAFSSIPSKPVEAREKSSLEFKLGTYWLVRIGIIMFLAALVFAGNYAYENIVSSMGPAPKVALLYVVGGVLTGLGVWMERRGDRMLNFSRVLFAGGLSAIYYITYAAHYVPRLRVIESPIVAGVLLLLWAAVMAWIADRRKSQTLAVLSVLLAYFTSSINPMAEFTLFSNFVLTAAAVFFFIRHRWAVISWVGLVGTYASFGYWRAFGLVDHGGFPGNSHESPWLLLAILAGYWIVFTAATFSRPGRDSDGASKITFLTANNSAFFGYGCLLLAEPEFVSFWQWAMGLGALLLALSLVTRRLAPEDVTTKNAYFSQGLLLVTVGLIAYFEGRSLALVMAMESVFLMVSGTRANNLIAKLGSYATALAAVLVESWVLFNEPRGGIYTAMAVGGFLLFNAWWVRSCLSEEKKEWDDGRAWVLSVGALWTGLLYTSMNVEGSSQPVVLSVEVLLFSAIFFALRLREALLFSQLFWMAGFAAWLVLGWDDSHPIGSGTHLAVLFSALVLGHAWKWVPFGRSYVTTCAWQAIYALGVVAVLAGWLLPGCSPEKIVGLGVILSLLLLAYGAATRAGFLAAFGQIFLGISAGVSITLDSDRPWSWAWALLPIFELIAIRRGVPIALSFLGWNKPGIRTPLSWISKAYAFASLILGWIWLARYIPEDWRISAYLTAGFILFLVATFTSKNPPSFEDRMLLVFGGIFAFLGLGYFLFGGMPSFQNGLALLLIPLAEMVARKKQNLPDWVRMALVVSGMVAILFYVTRFTALHLSSNYWTVSWGLLAGVVFVVGFALKHSWYRWAGLALLALAIGRVGVVDIWRFDTIYRILSLFVLSGMAIGLGFLYTRYQEKMKEWL